MFANLLLKREKDDKKEENEKNEEYSTNRLLKTY